MGREGNRCKVDLSLAMKAQRVEERFSSFFNFVARWRWKVNATPWLLSPRNNSVPIV